jgi:hypothetical protein
MKFERNKKERRLFLNVSIISFYLALAGFVWTIINYDQEIFSIAIMSVITSVIYFIIARNNNKDFIEFDDTFIYIIGSSSRIVINLGDIIKILIPSEIALRHKWSDNNVVFHCGKVKYTTSYSEDIKKYVTEHFPHLIEYYDSIRKLYGN